MSSWFEPEMYYSKDQMFRAHADANGVEPTLDENGYIIIPATSKWSIGGDIGQSRDPSAICIIEQVRRPMDVPDSSGIRQLGPSTSFIRKIRRIALGTPYGEVLNAVAFEQSRLPAGIPTWVDCTGNRAVRELADQLGVAISPIQITSGDEYKLRWNELGFRSISKSALVFSLQASLERGELLIPMNADGDALIEELGHYKMTRSLTGAPMWTNVGVAHDDLCVATALASFALNEAHDSVGVQLAPWAQAPTQLAPAPVNPAGKTNEQLAAERSAMLVRG